MGFSFKGASALRVNDHNEDLQIILSIHFLQTEDISDERFAERHARCEVNERKRFAAAAMVNNRRGPRANRADSTTSTVSIPPTPATPNTASTVTSEGQPPDFESAIALSMIQTPSDLVDLTQFDDTPGRKRSSSVCSRSSDSRARWRSGSVSDRGELPQPEIVVNPWEPRKFPLDDRDFDRLQKDNDELPPRRSIMPRPPSHSAIAQADNHVVSPLAIPMTTTPVASDEEDVDDQDDPNDPEWSVIDSKNRVSNIVLKLKR